MAEKFFSEARDLEVAEKLATRLRAATEVLTPATAGSTRAAGDALEEIVRRELPALLGDTLDYYKSEFGRKDMQDLEFGLEGCRYLVDVKTFRREVGWGAPNLTSVARLADLYEDDAAYFVVLLITYDVEGDGIEPHHVELVPIEWIGWSSMKIGALGKGQIQLRDSAKVAVSRVASRQKWIEEFYDTTIRFYEKETTRIEVRIEDFRARRASLRGAK